MRRGSLVGDALRLGAAIVLVDRSGRETLALCTPETVDVDAGPVRVSTFGHDGPIGHMTRATIEQLAVDLERDWCPVSVRTLGDDDVIAWTSTEEFAAGARAVAEVQRWNAGLR